MVHGKSQSLLLLVTGLACTAVAFGGCQKQTNNGSPSTDPDAGGAGAADATCVQKGDADAPLPSQPPSIPPDSCLPSGTPCADGCTESPTVTAACMGGLVHDQAGRPLEGVLASLCYGGTCVTDLTDPQGFFSQSLPATTLGSDEDVLALYFAVEGKISPFCRFEHRCAADLLFCRPFMLYDAPTNGLEVPSTFDDVPGLSEETRVEASDGAALVLPVGATAIFPGLENTLSLTQISLAGELPCFIDPERRPIALYAVHPHDTFIVERNSNFSDLRSLRAQLDFPNPCALPAQSRVDVYVLGGKESVLAETSEGEWRRWTSATVTADGKRIQTSGDEGLSYLNWIGLYPQD